MTKREQELWNALSGLVGLIHLFAGRADITAEQRNILTSNHRYRDATEALEAKSYNHNNMELVRSTLKFYADPPKDEQIPDFYSELAFGDKARAALAAIEAAQ